MRTLQDRIPPGEAWIQPCLVMRQCHKGKPTATADGIKSLATPVTLEMQVSADPEIISIHHTMHIPYEKRALGPQTPLSTTAITTIVILIAFFLLVSSAACLINSRQEQARRLERARKRTSALRNMEDPHPPRVLRSNGLLGWNAQRFPDKHIKKPTPAYVVGTYSHPPGPPPAYVA